MQTPSLPSLLPSPTLHESPAASCAAQAAAQCADSTSKMHALTKHLSCSLSLLAASGCCKSVPTQVRSCSVTSTHLESVSSQSDDKHSQLYEHDWPISSVGGGGSLQMLSQYSEMHSKFCVHAALSDFGGTQ